MTRMKNVLGAALLLVPFAAGATTPYTFESLSKIEYTPGINLTGVLAGDSAPSTVSVPGGVSQCETFMVEMLKAPGKYRLNVTTKEVDAPVGGGTVTVWAS